MGEPTSGVQARWSDQRLRKQERLLKRREFLTVQNSGRRYYGRLFMVIWAPGVQPWPRLGVTVSKKVGRAVVRSRSKRLLREVFRRNKALLPSATDIVLIASPAIVDATYRQVEDVLMGWIRHKLHRGGAERNG